MQATNGDLYLSNLLRLLALLDANNDTSDGFQIDAAANNAIGAAVTGTRTLDFAASAAAFANDATVVALATALNRTLVSADEALARYQLLFRQSRSSSIALTSDDNRAVVVNRQKASVSVIRVRNTDGSDAAQLLAEIPVGKEPRFVAHRAQRQPRLRDQRRRRHHERHRPHRQHASGARRAIDVGVEPRGIAITPNGTYAFIAGHTTGDVAVVRLSNNEVVSRIHTGGNPYAIAISNDGDANDNDERVYVTQLFGEVIDQARPDGFDDAKQGVVSSFRVGEAVDQCRRGATVTRLLLKPLAVGLQCRPPQLLPADARCAADRRHGQVFQQRRGWHAATAPRRSPRRRSARMSPRPTSIRRRPHRPRGAEGVPEHAVRRAAARPIPLRAQRRRATRAAGELQRQRAGARRRAEPGDQRRDAALGEPQHLRAERAGARDADDRRSTSYSSTTSSPSMPTGAARTSWSSAAAATT